MLQSIVPTLSDLRRTPSGYPEPSTRRWCSKATTGESELTQERSVDAERPRLSHRQDRHVHHVRERVVVVVLERRQREERGPVLRDRVGEAVDERAADGDVRLPLGL